MLTVKHSGNIGDILYAMPTLLHLSKTMNQSIKFYLNPTNGLMSIELANVLKPLLEHQTYVDSVEFYSEQHVDYDLDLFRNLHTPGSNLGLAHAQLFNFETSILEEQSIFVQPDYDAKLPIYDIIVNRTERYTNPSFPWQYVLNEEYNNHTKCFVGLKSEYDLFVKTFGIQNIEYVSTTDYLQVAWLINKSKIFIGNCSSPYAIAETMKHSSIQESCIWCLSCLYQRPNAYYFTDKFFQI